MDAGDICVIAKISEVTGIRNEAFKDPAVATNVTFVTFSRLPGGIETTIERHSPGNTLKPTSDTGLSQLLLTRMGIVKDGKCINDTVDCKAGPNITSLRNWSPIDLDDKASGETRTMLKDAELNIQMGQENVTSWAPKDSKMKAAFPLSPAAMLGSMKLMSVVSAD